MFGMIPLPYKLLAGAALIVGVFIFGYMKGSAVAETRIAEFAAKESKAALELEKESAKISTRVVTQYVDKVRVIKEKEYVYRDIIKDSVPSQYDLSSGWVYTHDISASAGDADPARASDETPSGIKDNKALETIAGNYAICQANAEQLTALQAWIRENKAKVEAKNK